MLLRNLDHQMGTARIRYIVTQLYDHIIEAKIAMGNKVGKIIFIPRITHVTQENEYPFKVKRNIFPIKSAFAITANKSQGQASSKIGVPTQ